MHTAKLCDGVVAVLNKHLFVECLCFVYANGGVNANITSEVEIVNEFIEE